MEKPLRTYTQNRVIWKDIPGFEGIYKINNLGVIKSIDKSLTIKRKNKDKRPYILKISGKILKHIKNRTGYYQVNLNHNGKKRIVNIHRLLAEVFIPNPENKPQVNHKDGNKLNNSLDNLEWCTASENSLHAHRVIGIKVWHKGKTGENTPTSKPLLQRNMSGDIVKRWSCGLDAVREMGYDSASISRCANGLTKKSYGFKWEFEKTKNK